MSERTPTPPPVDADRELEPVTAEERAAAAALAEALEGGRSAAAPDEAELARALQVALRGEASGDPAAGREATDRALRAALGPAPDRDEAPATDLESARAGRLGVAVDRLVAGLPPADVPLAGGEELLRVAVMVHAGSHAVPLAAGTLVGLEDAALGSGVTGRAASRLRRWAVGLAVAAGLALAVGTGVQLARDRGPAAEAPPAHLTSRSTRDVLPEAFPADQTASARIDLVYQSRLGAYREVLLAGPAPRRGGGRR